MSDAMPVSLERRFWAKVEKGDGCWLWAGTASNGYGIIRGRSGRNTPAHRVAYELVIGPIPEGLEIDHLCRNRGCVRPDHLEPVTHAENIRRGSGPVSLNANKTACVHGHELAGDNLYVTPDGRRQCRSCRAHAKASFNARRALVKG